jgi:DNA polymerase-1
MIAVDIETFDPNLEELGDGALRGDGDIVCVGMYNGSQYYFFDTVTDQLKDILASDETKVFHNGIYDTSWLILGAGLKIGGRYEDTMTRMGLINEHVPHMDLQSCCDYFRVEGKNRKDTIEVWAAQHGIEKPMHCLLEIYNSGPEGKEAVKRYCLQDCKATYDLWHAQEIDIERLGLQSANQQECDMYPITLEMKKNGVIIDLAYINEYRHSLEKEIDEQLTQLKYEYGITEEILRSPKQMTTVMHELGIKSPLPTPSGAESWSALALKMIDHPVCNLITKSRSNLTIISTFFDGTFSDKYRIGNRIHSTLYPSRRHNGGTQTGRFSSRNPNMQNIPAREEKHGVEIRRVIIPEEGCMIGAFDYSQIEYLLLAHYAVGPRSDWLRQRANEGVDFHNLAMELTKNPNRTLVKTFNYGAMYGIGLNKVRMGTSRKAFMDQAAKEGRSFDEYTASLYSEYFREMSFIRPTMKNFENQIRSSGYVRSFERIHHVYSLDKIYAITNYVIQGTAAEILKKGLIDTWKAGCCNVLKLHLTVHDENVPSIPYNSIGTEAAMEMQRCMENAYKDRLKVPMKANGEVGGSWGYWHGDVWEDMKKGKFNRRPEECLV